MESIPLKGRPLKPIEIYRFEFENIEQIDTWNFTVSAENEIVPNVVTEQSIKNYIILSWEM